MTTGQTAVGTTIAALNGSSVPVTGGGVRIKALAANTGQVYVGGAGVTTGNGFQLSAKEEVVIPAAQASDVADIKLIASAISQNVCWALV